jgi:predicted permease
LNIFLSILTNTILPTLLIAGVGFILARWVRPDRRSLTKVIMNAFIPCLIFQNLTLSNIPLSEFGRMALFTVVAVMIAAGVVLVISAVLRLNHVMTTTFVLMVMFSNVGNMGLPVITLAFGQEALTFGTVYFVVNNLLLYTVGTLIASSGREPLTRAISRVLRMPVIYAVLAAGIFQVFHLQLPKPAGTAVEMLARAAIPTMLLMLGMQLHSAGFKITHLVGVGTFARLVAVPGLAFLANSLIGLSGAALQAGMLEAAMPSGVMASVFAAEYDIEPEFAANMVLFTTLFSPLTLTILISFLH